MLQLSGNRLIFAPFQSCQGVEVAHIGGYFYASIIVG